MLFHSLRFRSLSVLLALVASAGCGTSGEHERRIVALEAKLDSLADSVRMLLFTQRIQALTENADRSAYLTPGAEGYSVVTSDLGPLTVKLEDVQGYANGSRITLRVGNLTGATIDGAKADIEWGPTDQRGFAQEPTGSKQVRFSESLLPSSWTRVRVVLEGTSPADLGFVRIKDMTHEAIRLLR